MDNPATDHGGPATAAPDHARAADKKALRRVLRERRRAFGGGVFPVPAPLLARLVPGAVVACYHPVGAEVDPTPLARAAAEAGCRLALPHVVDRATPLRFLHVDEAAVLEEGPFGLVNPPAHAPEMIPDVILTPLVGFDRRAHRLGQGAGHYDRAFAAYPAAWRIGVAWSVQEVDALPDDPWDVPLHAIATEREWMVAA